jgi:hypothetical protein
VTTLSELLDNGTIATIPAHLEAQADVPILTEPQRQGDVSVWPTRKGRRTGQPIPPEGVALLQAEAGGHIHRLQGVGDVAFAPAPTAGLVLGTLTVGAAGTAFIGHDEHSMLGIGAGTYILKRQRTQMDEVRLVAD